MKNLKEKLAGILGALIIHLAAAIIFMSFRLSSLNREIRDEFVVEFEQSIEEESAGELIELPATSLEKILQGDEEMLNIARNLANKPEIQIDAADYIDMVKEELIESGQLGKDNYIDEQKNITEPGPDDNMAFEDKDGLSDEEKPKKSQEMAADYQGPTRIFYDLAGRNHTYLPIPIYKCQGSGKVVLNIEVNPKGNVEKATIASGESTTSDPCLTETAVRTALISRFSPDIKALRIQKGTLTYMFVAQ